MRKIMTQEDKELLLKDLCARLPYGVICDRLRRPVKLVSIKPKVDFCLEVDRMGGGITTGFKLDDVKPYLRPMSSMTEEEKKDFQLAVYPYEFAHTYRNELIIYTDPFSDCDHNFANFVDIQDWLNAHHFDYRGLIEKGLALEAPEGMYEEK